MDDTQSNRPDNLGDISDSGLIILKAKLVLAAIRHETVPAHIRNHAVQRPKMVTTPNLATVPLAAGSPEQARAANAVKTGRAQVRAADVLPFIEQARRAGATTLQQLADALAARGVPTPSGRGRRWHPVQVARIVGRYRGDCRKIGGRNIVGLGPIGSEAGAGRYPTRNSPPTLRTTSRGARQCYDPQSCGSPPGTLRDSLVLLAFLLEQETELEPMEFMTDTAASDAVFGLFWLLGYQFSPRLADLGDAKLWRIDRKADYGPFNSLAKGIINLGLICENWSDAIRLAGSLKLGHLKAAGIMRTLQIRDKPTPLARALAEIGRIAKTVHILHYVDHYVDDPGFRRRILTQLNHTELRHRLGRRIHHGERGEIRSPLRQGQEEQLGCLGLALNAVVHWNAIYMQEAIQQARADGTEVRNDDLAHLSPLIWRHLNFLGRYDFSLPDTVRNGGLRPLRNPNSAWEF